MKSNKGLQIGNLLYNHRGWACPISEIGADRVTVIARHYGEEAFLLEDMKEIDLSEDLIPKLGFEKEIQEKCHFDHFWIHTQFEEQDEEDEEEEEPSPLYEIKLFQSMYNGYWVEIYNYITGARFFGQLKFLHQLQNELDQCEIPFNINQEMIDKL